MSITSGVIAHPRGNLAMGRDQLRQNTKTPRSDKWQLVRRRWIKGSRLRRRADPRCGPQRPSSTPSEDQEDGRTPHWSERAGYCDRTGSDSKNASLKDIAANLI